MQYLFKSGYEHVEDSNLKRSKTFTSLISDLKQKGLCSYDVQIKDIDTYILGDIYIYRGTLTNGKNSKQINIIETYPYEYTITFDDFYKSSSNKKE